MFSEPADDQLIITKELRAQMKEEIDAPILRITKSHEIQQQQNILQAAIGMLFVYEF